MVSDRTVLQYHRDRIFVIHRLLFVIHRLQEVARKKRIPLYICFIDFTKVSDSVDRTFLWAVLSIDRFGLPQNMISVIHQRHDGIGTCMRLDGGVCSEWFAVEQGLCQTCELAPLLFNIFFAAVKHVAYTRFKRNKGIMDAF